MPYWQKEYAMSRFCFLRHSPIKRYGLMNASRSEGSSKMPLSQQLCPVSSLNTLL